MASSDIHALIAEKDSIESEISSHLSILSANDKSTLSTPLVDADGFPRADIDVYAVRNARVRIIELRNDLKRIIDQIAVALQTVYKPDPAEQSRELQTSSSTPNGEDIPSNTTVPFAKVDGVSPGSPASEAGLQRDDLFLRFGTLSSQSFTTGLQPLAGLVAANENRNIPLLVKRAGQNVILTLTPRKGWGGRGLLGCHIVPYVAP